MSEKEQSIRLFVNTSEGRKQVGDGKIYAVMGGPDEAIFTLDGERYVYAVHPTHGLVLSHAVHGSIEVEVLP